MNVLHIFGRMDRGGAEMRTVEVLRHLAPSSAKFSFLSLSGQPGELDAEICRLGGRVHLVKLDASFPRRFPTLLRRERVDVVHSHVEHFSGLLLLLARWAGVPIRIAHFRSTTDGHRPTLRRRLQRSVMKALVNRNATRILAVSRGAMESQWGPSWEADGRCEVVYNGLDTAPFSGPAERDDVRAELGLAASSYLVIHVGRLDPAKNHAMVLDVFAQLARRLPDAHLALVGRGGNSVEACVREQAGREGILERVHLLGVRHDVPRLLKAADLMIFPSLWEGLPGAVLEACAAGIPVVGSAIPGVVEIAGYFPSVTVMADGAGVAAWADHCMEAIQGRKWLGHFHGATALESTPFSMDACTTALLRIYGLHAR
jgi:glycosyltransferase involved in cell wall biosynthesis